MFKSVKHLSLLLIWSLSMAEADESPTPNGALSEREKRFAAMLSEVTLIGSYTQQGKHDTPEKERYTIYRVTKLAGQDLLWRFDVRMQFGTVDLRLPLPLPVRWAGNTPVIVMDNYAIPGLGSFSARVLFDGNRYAGTWQHGKTGGHLSGEIVKDAAQERETNSENPRGDATDDSTQKNGEK